MTRAVNSASPVTGTNGGVIAQSKPNTAIAVTPEMIAAGNLGTISAGPHISCFDVDSFYFACSLNAQQGVASVAVGCDVSVTGFKDDGRTMVGSVAFNYDPAVSPSTAP